MRHQVYHRRRPHSCKEQKQLLSRPPELRDERGRYGRREGIDLVKHTAQPAELRRRIAFARYGEAGIDLRHFLSGHRQFKRKARERAVAAEVKKNDGRRACKGGSRNTRTQYQPALNGYWGEIPG